jgi:PDZ domain-containing secreted protein
MAVMEMAEALDKHHMIYLQGKHNHKGYGKMKHKITVILSVLVIVGVLAASFVSYEHYRQWRDVQVAKAHTSAVIHAQLAKAEAEQRTAKINGLKAQCTKDHASYLALTPAQKAKSVGLDCNPALELVQ